MEMDSEIVSVSLPNDEKDQIIIRKILQKSKKIFKIVQPKKYDVISIASTKKVMEQYKIYNRKEKSLEELSKRFIHCLMDYDEKVICLDEITKELGVERRRIYDIINILESLKVVQRKCKNKYTWKGFKTIYQTVSNYANLNTAISQKKEKSLEVLSAGFIKLFLQNKPLWTLEEAARKLGHQQDDQNKLKTKVRRLYDIANVLKSIGLIRKTHLPNTKKPAFEWVGAAGMQSEKENIRQPISINAILEKCANFVDFMVIQKSKPIQDTEQKIKEPPKQFSTITPKLRRTFTIIAPRVTTPKKYPITPKKNSSKEPTPNKQVVSSLIGKFNQHI